MKTSAMASELTDILKRNWTIHHELPEENQMALFDPERSELLILNVVGAVIWDELDGRKSLADIVESLSAEALEPPPREQVEREVLEFADALLERGALTTQKQ